MARCGCWCCCTSTELGYTPVQLAFLFLLYEFFGIVTNLVGGWLAARTGLGFTLVFGLALQVVALSLLAFLEPSVVVAVSVAYVMGCQALSGIAKDLTKMSAKSAVKVLVPAGDDSGLFKWVAVLTGSKNALKGAGFFVGGLLLTTLGFRGALLSMAGGVLVVLAFVLSALPANIGKTKSKPPFMGIHHRIDLGERIVGRGEHGELTAVEGVDQVDVRVELAGQRLVSVLSIGLFDAATVTGSCAIPATEPGPSGTCSA